MTSADRTLPDRVIPNRVIPDGVIPDRVIPNRVIPDGVIPDRVIPNRVIPDRVIPDGVIPAWTERVSTSLGRLEGLIPAGEQIWRATIEGHRVLVKSGPSVTDEADGLRRLAAIEGAPPIPELLYADDHVLVEAWIEHDRRTRSSEEILGSELATLHSTLAQGWGGGSSWIGACRIDPAIYEDGPAFYGARLTALAQRAGMEAIVMPLVERLADLAPFDSPVPLHGDLWWGNVVWGPGERAWLVDPSFHHGHPEEDLAMLALFGDLPVSLVESYCDVRPPEAAWRERIALWQLYPLLVHTVLFGGSYGKQAEEAARSYL